MAEDIGGSVRWGRVQAWWMQHPLIDADAWSVMAALATYVDDAGECEPSQATIARWLQRSRPWVNRVIAELVVAGLIQKTGRERPNGGTTSCRYRLAMTPPDPGHTGDTPRQCDDTPRHGGDRNQRISKHNLNARSAGARTNEFKEADKAEKEALVAVERDWEPSAGAIAEALRLRPSADIEGHTARFVARCRSKGYRYLASTTDDAWMSWLLEDTDRDGARIPRGGWKQPAGQSESASASFRGGRADHRYDRLDAWVSSASEQLTT